MSHVCLCLMFVVRKFDKFMGKLRPQEVECLPKTMSVMKKLHINIGSEIDFAF